MESRARLGVLSKMLRGSRRRGALPVIAAEEPDRVLAMRNCLRIRPASRLRRALVRMAVRGTPGQLVGIDVREELGDLALSDALLVLHRLSLPPWRFDVSLLLPDRTE